jgi:hypothetical protein
MTKRSIGPAGASIVSDDGKKIKKVGTQTKLPKLGEEMTRLSEKERKLVKRALDLMKDSAGTFKTTITEVVGKKGVGPAGQRVREMNKKSKPVFAKGGGLMEATARLKAKGMKEGGMVVKDKIVSIDKSPNSGLITTKGFGASRRT